MAAKAGVSILSGRRIEKGVRVEKSQRHGEQQQGHGKAVIFCQSMPARHQGLSDFTRPHTAITIVGKPFDHLLYQSFSWHIAIGVLFILSRAIQTSGFSGDNLAVFKTPLVISLYDDKPPIFSVLSERRIEISLVSA